MATYSGIVTSLMINEGERLTRIKSATGIYGKMDGNLLKTTIRKNAKMIEKYRSGKRRPAYLMGIGIPQPTNTVKVVEEIDFQPRVLPINYRWVKKKS
ncbi:hypothetical protein [Bacillus subtilis]|uniref:hypothetical protein n=1 Tax=Bacillus subtilis TaxID=1423 RepID=UPI002DBDD626|nr:hypothetical protein [Bacillus subtilis]MEC2335131.1 hypothetical protein [Bacillus subtilis]